MSVVIPNQIKLKCDRCGTTRTDTERRDDEAPGEWLRAYLATCGWTIEAPDSGEMRDYCGNCTAARK